MSDTTNFAWTKPTVGGSAGAWGTILNTLFDAVDSDLATVKTTADAAMPKAGGTFTGEIQVSTDKYDLTDLGNMTGTATLDLSTARYFYGTVTGTVAIDFSHVPSSGEAVFVVMEITNGGSSVVSWPAALNWAGGSAPSLTASGVDFITLVTRDGGTTWYGFPGGLDLS